MAPVDDLLPARSQRLRVGDILIAGEEVDSAETDNILTLHAGTGGVIVGFDTDNDILVAVALHDGSSINKAFFRREAWKFLHTRNRLCLQGCY